MDVNAESIHGTTASPLGHVDFGRVTQKGRTLYLHVYNAPKDGILRLPMLGNTVSKVSVLGQGDLKAANGDEGITIALTGIKLDPDATVVKLELAEDIRVFDAPLIGRSAGASEGETIPFVKATQVYATAPNKDFDVHISLDGHEPKLGNKFVVAPTIGKTTLVKARCSYKGKLVGPTTTVLFSYVEPWAALAEPASPKEIKVTRYEGNFDKCDDIKGPPIKTHVQYDFDLGDTQGKENVALEYEGWINVPSTDVYNFSTMSDDGSRLYIDGKLVVDNDGLHSPTEVRASAPLAAGWHRIRVQWFNKSGGAELKVKWARRD